MQPCRQRDLAGVVAAGVGGPGVDDLCAVDPQTGAVVGGGDEGVGARGVDLDLAGPPHTERVRADGRVRRTRTPVEADRAVQSRYRAAGQIDVVVVDRGQPVDRRGELAGGNNLAADAGA